MENVPAEHRRSLKGSLAKYAKKVDTSSGRKWRQVREAAWAAAAREKVKTQRRSF